MAKNHEDAAVPKPVVFRITVGVTGHRKIPDSESVRSSIHQVLEHVSQRYQIQGPGEISFCVLTPLAEGADCIVADEILSGSRFNDPTIKVVLPLTVDDYRRDFTSAESRNYFENLMEKARATLTLRNQSIEEVYTDVTSNSDPVAEARRLAYEDVGRFVVDHCDILIALWDGEKARGKGGTADIVSYAAKTCCPTYIINPYAPENIQTPDLADQVNPFSGLDRSFSAVNGFNRQLADFGEYSGHVQSLYQDMFQMPPESINRAIPDDTKKAVKTLLMPYYAVASATAKSYQRSYCYVGLTAFWLAFAAVLTIGIGVILFNSEPVFFAIELFILITISLMILYADRFIRSHKKWMQYRFLTERIRSAFFLACCGTPLQPFHIPRRAAGQSNPDAWMTLVFEEIWSALPPLPPITEKNFDTLGDFIRRRWIDDQLEFHRRTIQTNEQRSHLLERLGSGIFYIAIGAAATHLVLAYLFASFHDWTTAHGLTLAALILPALAATIEAIRSHREYKRLAIRSARISFELQRLKTRLKCLSPDKLKGVVDDMTALMCSDGQGWPTMMGMAELHVVV